MAGNEWRGGLILLSAGHLTLDNAFTSPATNQVRRLCSEYSLGQQGSSSAEAQAELKLAGCCLLKTYFSLMYCQSLRRRLSPENPKCFPSKGLNHMLSFFVLGLRRPQNIHSSKVGLIVCYQVFFWTRTFWQRWLFERRPGTAQGMSEAGSI